MFGTVFLSHKFKLCDLDLGLFIDFDFRYRSRSRDFDVTGQSSSGSLRTVGYILRILLLTTSFTTFTTNGAKAKFCEQYILRNYPMKKMKLCQYPHLGSKSCSYIFLLISNV